SSVGTPSRFLASCCRVDDRGARHDGTTGGAPGGTSPEWREAGLPRQSPGSRADAARYSAAIDTQPLCVLPVSMINNRPRDSHRASNSREYSAPVMGYMVRRASH